jgi:hypothetical protein
MDRMWRIRRDIEGWIDNGLMDMQCKASVKRGLINLV